MLKCNIFSLIYKNFFFEHVSDSTLVLTNFPMLAILNTENMPHFAEKEAIKMGKFVIRKVATGVKFDLKARNGEIIATSEGYASKASCENGIESVRKNASEAEVVTEE